MATSKNKIEFTIRLKDLATQALKNMGATVGSETKKADAAFKKVAGGGLNKLLKRLWQVSCRHRGHHGRDERRQDVHDGYPSRHWGRDQVLSGYG